MAVDLYVTVPSRHPGARPRDYFSGSSDSVAWAIGHDAAPLAIHVSLGLALVAVVTGAAIGGLRSGRGAVGAWSLLGGLLAFGAIACYATALFLAGRRDQAP